MKKYEWIYGTALVGLFLMVVFVAASANARGFGGGGRFGGGGGFSRSDFSSGGRFGGGGFSGGDRFGGGGGDRWGGGERGGGGWGGSHQGGFSDRGAASSGNWQSNRESMQSSRQSSAQQMQSNRAGMQSSRAVHHAGEPVEPPILRATSSAKPAKLMGKMPNKAGRIMPPTTMVTITAMAMVIIHLMADIILITEPGLLLPGRWPEQSSVQP